MMPPIPSSVRSKAPRALFSLWPDSSVWAIREVMLLVLNRLLRAIVVSVVATAVRSQNRSAPRSPGRDRNGASYITTRTHGTDSRDPGAVSTDCRDGAGRAIL